MAETYLAKSVYQMCRTIEHYLDPSDSGTTPAGQALGYLCDGIRAFRRGVWRDEHGLHRHNWAFLRPLVSLAIGGALTGTADGVFDGTNTTVTADAAMFDQSMVGQQLTDTTGLTLTNPLTIITYTSPTVVLCSGGKAFTDLAISVCNRGLFALPADFGGMIGDPVLQYAPANYRMQLARQSVERVEGRWRDYQQAVSLPSWPYPYWSWEYAILVQPAGSFIMIAPLISSPMTLNFRYTVRQGDLTDAGFGNPDTSPTYLPGSPDFDDPYEACGLAEAESKSGRVVGVMEARKAKLMAEAAMVDRQDFDSNRSDASLADSDLDHNPGGPPL